MTAIARRISVRTGTFVSMPPMLKSLALAAAVSLCVRYVSSAQGYNTLAIYSGVFDLLTIFTGFLATFYVFVVTKGNPFLENIKGTSTYRMVLRLLKFTIFWSAAIILYSYLLMVTNLKDFDLLSIPHLAVFFWLSNVFLIAINFARCVGHFFTMVEAEK